MDFAAHIAAVDAAALAHLGGRAVYTPSSGAPVEVPALFSAAATIAPVGQAGVVSTAPTVFLRLEGLPSDPEDDEGATVTVNGKVYRVREPHKDGEGGVLLLLHEA